MSCLALSRLRHRRRNRDAGEASLPERPDPVGSARHDPLPRLDVREPGWRDRAVGMGLGRSDALDRGGVGIFRRDAAARVAALLAGAARGGSHRRPSTGRDRVKARVQLVLAAACFSTAGAAIKWCSFGGWQIAAFRALVAMAAIVVLIPEARRSWNRRVGLVALAYAAAGLLFVLANKLTTAANTVFLQATNPLFVVALVPWLLHERATRRDPVFMAGPGPGPPPRFVGGGRPSAPRPGRPPG